VGDMLSVATFTVALRLPRATCLVVPAITVAQPPYCLCYKQQKYLAYCHSLSAGSPTGLPR
jgi:hypothetical protein